jgi:hypothetical protein
MSTGGIFMLISNDGKQDRMLMASALLSKRLQDVRQRRVEQGKSDTNPTLSDIEKTHVLFMNAHFKPFAAIGYEYNKVPVSNATLGTKVQFSIPQFGDFFSDMVVHIKFTAPTTAITGADPATTGSDTALYRWCEYPGERVLQKVSMDVNGNPLDEYYPDTYNFHRQFRVSDDKLVGWNRNMGQEQSKEGYFVYNQVSPAVAGDAADIVPHPARACVAVKDGHQTYKTAHSDLELFIPLLFWFNTDPRLAIPSVAIPYGQRFLNIDLATKEQLLRVIKNPSSLTNGAALTNPTVTSPTIANCDLYINNIFVNPDIHDIFIARIGFTLVRVHRRQVTNVNKASDSILLQQLKWPVETLYLGIRPSANQTVNANVLGHQNQDSIVDPQMEDWHRFSQVTNAEESATDFNGVSDNFHLKSERNHVSNLSITAHGIPIYNGIPAQFFNSYIPYQYGGWNIRTPTDPGVFMITFNLYPGTYQPSGHINVSRAREFYLSYNSTYVTSSTTADLVVVAVAINFLLISDGSAVLRYTT